MNRGKDTMILIKDGKEIVNNSISSIKDVLSFIYKNNLYDLEDPVVDMNNEYCTITKYKDKRSNTTIIFHEPYSFS